MERDLPNSNTSIRARTRQLPNLPATFDPQDSIDTTHARVLDRNVETYVFGAPYVHMRVE